MSKNVDWMSVPFLTGSDGSGRLAAYFMGDRGREPPRVFLGEGLEKHNCEIGRLRLRRSRIVLNPLLNRADVLFRPIVNVLPMSRIGIYPSLRQAVMSVGPLGNQVRLAHILILLEPGFDVWRGELTLFGTVTVFHDGAQCPRNSIAQSIVGRREVRRRRRGSIVRRGRWPGPKIFVFRERLRDQR